MTINRALASFGVRHLPQPAGRFKVGCRDILHGIGKNKGTLMRLYYPCEEPPDPSVVPSCWASWLPEHAYIYGYAAHSSSFLTRSFLLRLVEDVYIPAILEAPPLAGPFPVIVFSHGIAGCRTTYSTLCCHLASNGFIVAALEHRDHTACATFYFEDLSVDSVDAPFSGFQGYEDLDESEAPKLRNLTDLGEFDPNIADSLDETDGAGGLIQWDARTGPRHDQSKESVGTDSVSTKTAPQIPKLKRLWIPYRKLAKGADFYGLRHGQLLFRVKECIRAANVLEHINADRIAVTALRSHAGTMKIEDGLLVGGHSLGAATALMVLRTDSRFKSGLVLDPWMFPLRQEDLLPFRQPVLCVPLERFQTRENVRLLQQQARGANRHFITIKGACHVNHSDFPFLCDSKVIRYFLGERFRLGRFKVLELTTELSKTFLENHDYPKSAKEKLDAYCEQEKRYLSSTLRMPSLFG